ncbi:MAG: hypothetical protein K2L94_03340, partial [Alphaproteobacteria bacterium]|nr:hypothetical protein [Alphaproteobacteria bacterium]
FTDGGSVYHNYTECVTCPTNYQLTTASESAPPSGCSNTFTYKTCTCKSGVTCSNCSDTTWAAYGTGYQRYIKRTCDCGTCNTSYQYRCAAGYYGTTYNGTSGCTRCPNNGNSAAGTTTQTGCYITSGSDTNGVFVFETSTGATYQCHYQ